MRHIIRHGLITRRDFVIRSATAAIYLALGGRISAAQGKANWNAAMELAVTFTTFETGSGRIQRPYIAVWVEDAGGNPVKTLGLWMLSPPRGNRYLNDLRRWYAQWATDPAFAPTTTSPTPNPGGYTVVWDGKNDKGAAVDQGEYFICIESAREHGPYSLVRGKISLGNSPLKQNLVANGELKDVSLEYRKRP